MQIKLIFTRKVLYLASFWKWEFLNLGSSLFMTVGIGKRTNLFSLKRTLTYPGCQRHLCRNSANTETSRRTREKPLEPRVTLARTKWNRCPEIDVSFVFPCENFTKSSDDGTAVRYIIHCRNKQSAQYNNHTKNSSHFENIYYLFKENEDNNKIK